MRRFVEANFIGQVELQEIAVGHHHMRVIFGEGFERVEAGSSRHSHTAHLHSKSSPPLPALPPRTQEGTTALIGWCRDCF